MTSCSIFCHPAGHVTRYSKWIRHWCNTYWMHPSIMSFSTFPCSSCSTHLVLSASSSRPQIIFCTHRRYAKFRQQPTHSSSEVVRTCRMFKITVNLLETRISCFTYTDAKPNTDSNQQIPRLKSFWLVACSK